MIKHGSNTGIECKSATEVVIALLPVEVAIESPIVLVIFRFHWRRVHVSYTASVAYNTLEGCVHQEALDHSSYWPIPPLERVESFIL